MDRYGIVSGYFNPIHKGHMNLKKVYINSVRFLFYKELRYAFEKMFSG